MTEAPTPDHGRNADSMSALHLLPPIPPKHKRRWPDFPYATHPSTPLSAALSNPVLFEHIEALEAIGHLYRTSLVPTPPSVEVSRTPVSSKSIASAPRSRSSSTSPFSGSPSSPLLPPSSPPSHICLVIPDHNGFESPLERKGRTKTKEGGSSLNTPRKNRPSVSPYFLKSPSKRSNGERISCIPFPPLDATSFGLVQENLRHDPFQLLIAVIFLTKTRGSVAIPVFYDLITRYPTPAALAVAEYRDIVSFFEHLGLQNQRAVRCIKLAKAWLEIPPRKGKRYRRLHYPTKDDGKDIGVNEGPIEDDDGRVAWEVGHLAGLGAYAIDSWRIFCRDELRGLPAGLPDRSDLLRDPTAKEEELAKEWTRVLPLDKELRAYLRWRWLRVGFEWDPVSGERKVADERFLAGAVGGGVIYEGDWGREVWEDRDWVSGEFGDLGKGPGRETI